VWATLLTHTVERADVWLRAALVLSYRETANSSKHFAFWHLHSHCRLRVWCWTAPYRTCRMFVEQLWVHCVWSVFEQIILITALLVHHFKSWPRLYQPALLCLAFCRLSLGLLTSNVGLWLNGPLPKFTMLALDRVCNAWEARHMVWRRLVLLTQGCVWSFVWSERDAMRKPRRRCYSCRWCRRQHAIALLTGRCCCCCCCWRSGLLATSARGKWSYCDWRLIRTRRAIVPGSMTMNSPITDVQLADTAFDDRFVCFLR